ncbi:hypothetical protein BN946_scf184850.g15 [Trametes cinnabarina]|uniref:Uncharacterized protein n=1 Tax=Pycnoporus cinnabarinus TaxID=5643 RepID=A0A060SPK1_PYCCI|nr:hypothetical protein BN946_scf184850.g15 [Trametes cinnabarina]
MSSSVTYSYAPNGYAYAANGYGASTLQQQTHTARQQTYNTSQQQADASQQQYTARTQRYAPYPSSALRNGVASVTDHRRTDSPLLGPKPQVLGSHMRVLLARPELIAAKRVKDHELWKDNTARYYVFDETSLPLPLPANVDPTWSWPVFSSPSPGGDPGLVRRGFPLPKDPEDYDDYRVIIKMVGKNVQGAGTALHAVGIQTNNIYIHRGLMPFEAFDFNSSDWMTDCLRSPDNRYPTVALMLSKLIHEQCTWYKELVTREDAVWVTHQDNTIWRRWGRNPRLDCLWIVAIRRTLPDAKGLVYYFPELELHPLTLVKAKSEPA